MLEAIAMTIRRPFARQPPSQTPRPLTSPQTYLYLRMRGRRRSGGLWEFREEGGPANAGTSTRVLPFLCRRASGQRQFDDERRAAFGPIGGGDRAAVCPNNLA